MNTDLTAEIRNPFYRHTLVLFGHYTSRANLWQALQIVPKNALEQKLLLGLIIYCNIVFKKREVFRKLPL
jgi:hypothetical protein